MATRDPDFPFRPAFRSEVDYGLIPPYEFDCTYVRVELHGVAKQDPAFPRPEVVKANEQFFTELAQILLNCGGTVHALSGYDVTFYFKDSNLPHKTAEDKSSSVSATIVMALAEINSLAKKINELPWNEKNRFFITSCIVSGTLVFRKTETGRNDEMIDGSLHRESSDMISSVPESNSNRIFLNKHTAELFGAQPLIKFVSLKNRLQSRFQDEILEMKLSE